MDYYNIFKLSDYLIGTTNKMLNYKLNSISNNISICLYEYKTNTTRTLYPVY